MPEWGQVSKRMETGKLHSAQGAETGKGQGLLFWVTEAPTMKTWPNECSLATRLACLSFFIQGTEGCLDVLSNMLPTGRSMRSSSTETQGESPSIGPSPHPSLRGPSANWQPIFPELSILVLWSVYVCELVPLHPIITMGSECIAMCILKDISDWLLTHPLS